MMEKLTSDQWDMIGGYLLEREREVRERGNGILESLDGGDLLCVEIHLDNFPPELGFSIHSKGMYGLGPCARRVVKENMADISERVGTIGSDLGLVAKGSSTGVYKFHYPYNEDPLGVIK